MGRQSHAVKPRPFDDDSNIDDWLDDIARYTRDTGRNTDHISTHLRGTGRNTDQHKLDCLVYNRSGEAKAFYRLQSEATRTVYATLRESLINQ